MFFWVQRFSYLSDLIARTVGLLGFSKEEGLLAGDFLYIFGFGEGLLRGKFLYIFGFVGIWVADVARRILGVIVFSGELLVSGKRIGSVRFQQGSFGLLGFGRLASGIIRMLFC